VTLFLAVAACGFHRQGITPVAPVMNVTYVDSRDEHTVFLTALRRSLVASGATLAPSPDKATATLYISRDDTGRRVLSVSARNTPTEYEVYYTVTFSVSADNKELLPAQTLTLKRDYSFDEETVLAKESEEEILRDALARDLAGIILRRLSSL
jgi:LPS-assembly lipoprotein